MKTRYTHKRANGEYLVLVVDHRLELLVGSMTEDLNFIYNEGTIDAPVDSIEQLTYITNQFLNGGYDIADYKNIYMNALKGLE